MTSRFVLAEDGTSLHVRQDGPDDGEAVIMVHGWPDTHQVWSEQVDDLVAAGYRVIRPDQRGFGASGRPEAVGDYHVFHAMTDLGSIMDALRVESAHLVGHDWGAPPCWLAAMMAADRVRSLTAVSVGHPTAFRKAGHRQMERSYYMLLFQFPDVAEQWLSNNDWENFRAMLGRPADVDDKIAALSESGALTASLNWYRANASPESLVEPPTKLPPVTVPTMGIMGRNDWALLPAQMENSAQYIAAEWRYELLAAAHWVQKEQPERFNELLLDWIRSN